jgi:hypothetical protein
LGQLDPVPKPGPDLADLFFGTGRCGPAGTREPSPRAPPGVGSAGQPAGGKFGSVCPSSQNGSRAREPVFWNWGMRPGRHPPTLPPHSPRRGECWTARGGEVWVSVPQLPKRVSTSPARFLELGHADRQAPANPPPALPTAWGVLGSPRGGPFGPVGPSSQTGPRPHRPVLGTGRCGPVGHPRTLSPRSPRGGERWGICGGEVWVSLAELSKRVTRS